MDATAAELISARGKTSECGRWTRDEESQGLGRVEIGVVIAVCLAMAEGRSRRATPSSIGSHHLPRARRAPDPGAQSTRRSSHRQSQSRPAKPPAELISHPAPKLTMADEGFLLSSAVLAGSSQGLASARAVGYTTQPKQTSRVVVLNPAVGLTVYDVSIPPGQAGLAG